jgi:hypothetical protein
MVSPNLFKSSENEQPAEINADAKKLFQVIYSEQNQKEDLDEDTPRIKVSTLISRLSFFYEKVRNAVDYDEDHLLRKNAIARILRRQVMIEGALKESKTEEIASHLLVELIRGSYLPNNKIPETKIKEIAFLLDKYIRLKDAAVARINLGLNIKTDLNKAKDLIREKNGLVRWLLALAACEIEETLAPNKVKQMIVTNMFSILSKKLRLPADLPYNQDLEIQIYLSIGRNFLKLDNDILNFVLFKYFNSDWLEINSHAELTKEDQQKIKKIAAGLGELRRMVGDQLVHPLSKQIDKIARRYSLYFSILSETIEQDPTKAYSEVTKGEKSFLALIRKVCLQKYKRAKKRLWRAAFRSIIYIFLTKSVFVFLIEIPAINWFGEPLNLISLAINVSFPAILLFFIVLSTRTPKEENTNKIVEGVKEIALTGSEKRQPLILRHPPRRSWLKDGIFNFIYAITFCVSIYFVIWALTKINFNWVSIIIFLFFLAFVSFFSILTTKGVKELLVVEKKENFINFFLDLFYMPIIIVGRWLSGEFSKINVFVFLFDFVIEAPFKVLVEIGEDWTRYVRERRDNLEN